MLDYRQNDKVDYSDHYQRPDKECEEADRHETGDHQPRDDRRFQIGHHSGFGLTGLVRLANRLLDGAGASSLD